MHYRTDYSPALLTSAPRVLQLGDWCLHYQAYASRSNDRRAPVLLLGGAFQSFRSFASEVAELLGDHPVILLDLPSQGGNLQLVPELRLEQLADLIAAFADELQLPPLLPIGLSYGSALAALLLHEHIQQVKPRLAYLDLGITYPEADKPLIFTRADIPKLKKLWEKRTKAMLSDKQFAPRPNDKCRWCFYRSSNKAAGGGQCKY